jgi:hypothetical protein
VNAVEHIEDWRGQSVVDPSGAELGKVDEIFFDSAVGAAVLIGVKSGLLGRHSSLIPLDGASFGRNYVRVAYSQSKVDEAEQSSDGEIPNHEALAQLGQAYGLRFSDGLELETADARQARIAEAEAARRRAAELAAEAEEKLARRDAAGERAMGARAEADQAQVEAEQARQAALEARERAQSYEQP